MATTKLCWSAALFVLLLFLCLQFFWIKYVGRVNDYGIVENADHDFYATTRVEETTFTIDPSLEESFHANCSSWNINHKWKSSVKPHIYLDPDKFLYPGIIWGPNNQIAGFKQSIYLAIKLNRTLVIPFFMAHETSEQNNKRMFPFQVIDVDRLCRFVSCISIPTLKKKCDGAFDVALQAMQSNEWDLQRFEYDTGMSIFNIKKNLTQIKGARELQVNGKRKANIPTLPNSNYTIGYQPWLSSDTSTIQKVYGTSARCAIHASTFTTIRAALKDKLAVPLERSISNISNIADNVLYSAVAAAVKHSPCIVEAAKAYMRYILKDNEYIGVHWRYDRDWRTCCDKNPTKEREKMCKAFIQIKPLDLAKGIFASLRDEEKFSKQRERNISVYIAMPPSMNDFKESTYQELKTVNKRLEKPADTLESFVSKHYKTCWEHAGWIHPSEILSMVENEIMLHSTWFFQSYYSSWSSNIVPQRFDKLGSGLIRMEYTASAYNVAFDAMKKRTTNPEIENLEID